MAPHAVIVIDPSDPSPAPDLRDAGADVVVGAPAPVIDGTGADVVVVVRGGIALPDGWLAPMLEPFADPWVAAVGPMFDAGPPAQRLGMQDAPPEVADAVHAALRLDGRCFAVRAATARAVGGLRTGAHLAGIEADDLCRRLAAAGHAIRVVESVHVHAEGGGEPEPAPDAFADVLTAEIAHLARVSAAGRGGPLVSAALIVKDEEENLPACLASLSGLVDEVVVYDTGSTDRTVEIARDAGARVIEGYWDDDFSRARNEAIENCRGEWVLSIDADEVATGNPSAVRTALEVNWGVDVLLVQITNMFGAGQATRSGLDHFGPRLLRRSRCRWRYRLHEQPWCPEGTPPIRGSRMSHLRMLHKGYVDEAAFGRDKHARNIRVAEAGVAELVDPSPAELAANLVNLGRSYNCAGRSEDALACYERVIAIDAPIGYRRTALSHGFESLMLLERLDEAEEWLALLREAATESNTIPRYLEGMLRFRRGDLPGALELFRGIEVLADDDGTARGIDFLAKVRGMAHLANGDWAEALDCLTLVATSGSPPAWGPMVVAAAMAGADLSVVTSFVTDESLIAACAELVSSLPVLAPPFLEQLWERFPGDPRILGAAARLGAQLSVGRALDWSARLRAAGVAERCPLRAIVADEATAPAERLRAAAVLEAAFGEHQPDGLVGGISSLLGPDERAAVGAEVAQLCPRLGASLLAA
ncbi:MAG TPA: glycosyltransferase [Acidimicrobiales bacterium]|nr:glycosyltransferase [Acidimicrobiales bacterium]